MLPSAPPYFHELDNSPFMLRVYNRRAIFFFGFVVFVFSETPERKHENKKQNNRFNKFVRFCLDQESFHLSLKKGFGFDSKIQEQLFSQHDKKNWNSQKEREVIQSDISEEQERKEAHHEQKRKKNAQNKTSPTQRKRKKKKDLDSQFFFRCCFCWCFLI